MLRATLTLLVALSLPVEAKTKIDTTLCQAIKSDNHALVKSKLKPLKETYESHKCFQRSLLEYAELNKAKKTREYLIRQLPYETLAKEAKDGRRVL